MILITFDSVHFITIIIIFFNYERIVDSDRLSSSENRDAAINNVDDQSFLSDGLGASWSLKSLKQDALLSSLSGSNWKVNPFCDFVY